jgi:hypothetical protein
MAAMKGVGPGDKAMRLAKKEAKAVAKVEKAKAEQVSTGKAMRLAKKAGKAIVKSIKSKGPVKEGYGKQRTTTIGAADMFTPGVSYVKNPLVGPMKQAVKKRK